jgi:hypothetical protein
MQAIAHTRWITGCLILAILFLAQGVPCRADSSTAWEAYNSGNYETAFREFHRLAVDGGASAQCNLGVMYANGRGVPQDYGQAVYWYREAADQGHATAQNNLGVMYAEGHGVSQDYSQAVYWYRKAADQGHATAQNSLGVRYAKGQGVPQDYSQAAYWYRKAAERGDASAQYNLGVMYQNGQGVQQDYRQAIYWSRKAADQGDASAQGMLGSMYFQGQGVPQDWVQAHLWFNLAVSQGQEEARESRDGITKLLTAEQLAEAQRLARNWRPIPPPEVIPKTIPPDSTNEQPHRRASPEPQGPDTSLVRKVQKGLNDLGYEVGPADGVPGPKTWAVVRAFQADAGLPIDGRIDEALLDRIKKEIVKAENRLRLPRPAPVSW